MKKLLSLILTLSMLISVFSGIAVFAEDSNILLYEDFDDCLFENPKGWSFPKEGASVQAAVALTGKAIKFDDTTEDVSVTVSTPYIPVESGQLYTGTAAVLFESGDGLRMYLKYYDADKKEIDKTSVSSTEKEWTELSVAKKAPEGAALMRLQLVTNKADITTGYYDNVEIIKGVKLNKQPTSIIPPTQNDPVEGKLIQPVGDKLQYNTYNEFGDKLGDFSTAGFYRGEYELPDSSKLPVAAVIEPSADPNSDDTKRIQDVIDEVYKNAANDFFKVIKIKAGRYNINSDGINLKSGIVLSGEGQGPEGTVLFATDKVQYTVIKVNGKSPVAIGNKHYILDEYLPAGTNKLTLSEEDVKNYKVGDLITIFCESTEEWNKAMDMVGVINVYNDDTSWKPGSTSTTEERYITAIDGNVITFDIPTYVPYQKKYAPVCIYKTDDSGRMEHIGIENLRLESYYNGDPTDEAHANNAITIFGAKNCYLRDISAKYFVVSLIRCGTGSKQITVKNCSSLEPISIINGSRRYPFYSSAGSQQTYYSGCYSYSGRHCYMASQPSTGPTVFTDNVKDNSNAQSETHGTWSTGTLYDNLFSVNGASKGWIGFTNRGIYGTQTAQGWTSAGTVAWNCLAPAIVGHKPPLTYQNFIIGEWGHYGDDASKARKEATITTVKKYFRTGSSQTYKEENFATSDNTSFIGDVYKESETAPVEPRSLFKAQLAERLTGSFKNAKPNAPVITSPRGEEEHKVTTNDVTFKGLYQKGAEKVTLYIDNQPYEAKLDNSNYMFEYTLNLADGVHKVYATQTIDGVESTKCADRFIVVKKLTGNADYLQSQYDFNMVHQIINDDVVSFDVYQNKMIAEAANKITVKVNGMNLISDVDPVMINDRVLVPMRAIFESFDADVQWDEATRTATATKESRVVQVTEDSTVTKVDGEDVIIDVPATIIDGRFLVPVRFISESFGATVEWNDPKQQVIITGGTVVYYSMHGLENELGFYNIIQSGDDGAGAVISNVLDGVQKTSWGVAIDNPNGAYGIFDVGFPKELKDFYISFNRGNQRVYTFDLLVSNDGVNYTKIYDHYNSSGTTLEFEVLPLNTKARFVKIVGYGNNTNKWNNFTEIAITENK